MTQTMSNCFFQCCKSDLKSWAGIVAPSDEALRELIETSELMDEIHTWYTDDSDDRSSYGLDTADRDVLFDVIAKTFANTTWPLNMERDRSDHFRNALYAGLKHKGWTYDN